jgi:hypothetical protein
MHIPRFELRRRRDRDLYTCSRCYRRFRATNEQPPQLLCAQCQRAIRLAAGDDPYVDLGCGD